VSLPDFFVFENSPIPGGDVIGRIMLDRASLLGPVVLKEWVWKFSLSITDYPLSDCLFEWVQLAT